MKKATSKSSLSKKLTQYGALTAALAGVTEASGQIIYTDITPDFAGGIPSDFFLDLNNDGTNDFRIYHDTDNDLYMNPLNANNEVLGSANVYYSYGYIYPYALNSGAIISGGATGNWYNEDNYVYGYTSLNFNSCQAGNWCSVTDKYLGLRFDIGGSIHYGWARLDVDANGDVWAVKDYAYNSVPNQAITAGQGTLGIDDSQNKFANIACVDRIVTISQLKGNANYRILSVTGQVVNEGTTRLETQNVSIESLSSGVYIVEVSAVDSNAVTRKKIAI